jgi:hypothetical protein
MAEPENRQKLISQETLPPAETIPRRRNAKSLPPIGRPIPRRHCTLSTYKIDLRDEFTSARLSGLTCTREEEKANGGRV